MSETDEDGRASVRLAAARARVAEATRVHEQVRAAAEEARRDRDRRAARALSVLSVVGLLLTTLLIVAILVLVSISGDGRAQARRIDDVLAAARTGITTTLTADPSRPKDYVDSVLAVSTGEFRARITASTGEIESSVAAQAFAATGQVVSAGIVGPDPGESAGVLLVAEATNPQLLGGGPGDSRIVLLVRMARVDGAWKIERAQLQ